MANGCQTFSAGGRRGLCTGVANTKGEAARTAAPARRTEAAGDRHRKDEATGTGEAVRTGAGDVTAILLLRGRGE